MRHCSLFAGLLLALLAPGLCFAQSPPGRHVFISVNGLGQAGDGEVLNETQSFGVYGETATASTSQAVSLAAGLFDIGGGFRAGRFGVGLAFTASGNTDSGVASASIPHPFLFDRPRTSVTTVDDLEHKERVLHLQAIYFAPIAEHVEISLFAGPSFYAVKHDYLTASTSFTESSTLDTVTVPVSRATASDSQIGYNIGAEALYGLTPRVAAAVLVRFTRASAALDLGGRDLTMNVGDLQFGGGLRFRF